MNSRWFKEERALPRLKQQKAIEDAEETLRHSTLIIEKLKRIITEDLNKTFTDDENVGKEGWEHRALANVGARKALRKLLELLP